MLIKKKKDEMKKQSFWEDLIENLPIGMMLLDREGKIIRMNKKQEEASKISRKEILGKTFEEAFPKTLEQGLKKPYFKLLKKKTPFDVIIDHYIPQYYSQVITYHARGSSFANGNYFIMLHEHAVELGHEKRLVEKRTKELQESKRFLESLIDASPNIVISTDLSDRIIIFNQTAEKIFGYKKEEVLKQKIDFLFKEKLNLPSIKRNPMEIHEIFCIKKNRDLFPASLRVTNIKNPVGKTIAKLFLLNDLTEKKNLEERLFLSEKLALYSELMGGIAHQLNNPLIGVVNFSEMLLKEMDEEDPKRELAITISKAGRECLKIINSVLNCIKNPHLTFQTIDIHEVLRNALLLIQEQFGEKLEKISIRINFDPNIPNLLGDPIQLKQCFLNMLTNSIQSIQGNGIIKIETLYDKKESNIRVIISDNGIGIPKEYLKKIFLPFFTLKKDSDRHGLGLSFAYQIIKNHGGEIYVESEEGKGSVFTIIFPLK